MKTYTVKVPIVGVAYIDVEAENEEDAITKAIDEIEYDHVEEWEAVRRITQGNILYATHNEASAEEN